VVPVSEAQGGTTAAAVRAEQIRTVFRLGAGVISVNPLNAAIVAAVMWSAATAPLLVSWVLAMFVVTVARVRLRRRYLSASPGVGEAPAWGRKFVFGAAAAGLLWGVGGALLYDPSSLPSQLVLVLVIGGMVAGASGTLAIHLPAFTAYAGTAILPVAVRLLAVGDSAHVTTAVLAIVFGVAMLLVSINTNRAVTEAFRLRFENQDLLSRLSSAQVSLAEANRTLEARVAERGAALERQSEALRDAQRMESVGLLAGGVAHDFNNLLTAVIVNVTELRQARDLTPDQRASVEEIHGAATRGAALVKQLLAFSRRQVMVQRVLDLNAVVAEGQALLSRLIGEHIELVVTMWAGPLPVRADPTQLQQVMINLATNARDAMALGGKLTIETALVENPAELTPGRYVSLSVRDTGVGMDTETRRLAFHPFYTTKDVGQGTGLGLATVHGIVEQSGGHVFVESEPGRGSCFRVFLPLVTDETIAAGPSQPAAPAAVIRRQVTVLVAEDDKLVRAVTMRILSRAGLVVLEAESGEQALAMARAHAGTIALLVSDVVMAGMGGLELTDKLLADRPDLRVLLMSGYSREALPPREGHRAIAFLPKPFTPDEMMEKVEALLALPPRADVSAAEPDAGTDKTEPRNRG
jgi:signal transduction histidine kinase/ActR/RegA family two-component response regulator